MCSPESGSGEDKKGWGSKMVSGLSNFWDSYINFLPPRPTEYSEIIKINNQWKVEIDKSIATLEKYRYLGWFLIAVGTLGTGYALLDREGFENTVKTGEDWIDSKIDGFKQDWAEGPDNWFNPEFGPEFGSTTELPESPTPYPTATAFPTPYPTATPTQ